MDPMLSQGYELTVKRDTGKLTGQVSYGGYLTDAAKNHTGNWDGDQIQVDLNYGAKVGKKEDLLMLLFFPIP